MRNIFTYKHVLLCLLSLIMQIELTEAQWSNDASQNNCVTNALKDQKRNCIANDGLNNFIIGWRNLEFTSNTMIGGKIYAQKFNAEGVVQWTENGILVNYSSVDDGHDAPQIIKSENGKVIFVWLKWGSGFTSPAHLYARKIGENGTGLWNSDVKLFNRSGGQGVHCTSPDNSNGIIVSCSYANGYWATTEKDIIAQRINYAGEIKWGTEGIDVCTATGSQLYARTAVNSKGETFITWRDSRTDPNGDIYAQKIDSSGTIKWETNGIAICNNLNGQEYPVLITDNNNGIIVAWIDKDSDFNMGIRVQRIDQDGYPLWTSNGVLVCNNTYFYPPSIVSDGAGGAIICWPDTRGADNDIYAQHINADGLIQWAAGGVPVSTASGNQRDPLAISDGEGGIIITWSDFRNDPNYNDIYAQRLNHAGTSLWQTNGVPVSTASGLQLNPSLTTDGNGGAVIAWDDNRNGTANCDIYIQKIDKNGNLGGVSNLTQPDTEVSPPVSIFPNPVKDNLCLKLNDTNSNRVVIRIFSVDGTLIREISTSDNKLLKLPASDLKKGIYILSIKGTGINYMIKIVKK